MFEIVEGLHRALHSNSTWAFVLLCFLFFGAAGALLGFIVDIGYKNSVHARESDNSKAPILTPQQQFEDFKVQVGKDVGNAERMRVDFDSFRGQLESSWVGEPEGKRLLADQFERIKQDFLSVANDRDAVQFRLSHLQLNFYNLPKPMPDQKKQITIGIVGGQGKNTFNDVQVHGADIGIIAPGRENKFNHVQTVAPSQTQGGLPINNEQVLRSKYPLGYIIVDANHNHRAVDLDMDIADKYDFDWSAVRLYESSGRYVRVQAPTLKLKNGPSPLIGGVLMDVPKAGTQRASQALQDDPNIRMWVEILDINAKTFVIGFDYKIKRGTPR